MPIFKFKNKDNSISGEFALVSEMNSKNDIGYDKVIPRNAILTFETLDERAEREMQERYKQNDYKY